PRTFRSRLHETLCLGIVVGISAPTHRADEPMVGKQPAISLTCILRASIRVVDAAPRRLPGSDGSLQRCNRQACVDRTADRISDHSARPGVEDGGSNVSY